MRAAGMACLLLSAAPLLAEEAARPDDILVWGRAIEQIGIAAAASEGTVGYRDFEHRPWSRVGELAETVPGLLATQHSGTGKANQYFLRGFNLDHGTDLAGHVDGAPVNMRSHGHGQGYLDLNFLIPEMIERIDYAKGPYRADGGDFGAAGTLRFVTRSRIAPMAELTIGQNGHVRGLLAGSAAVGGGDIMGAIEGTVSDGPWVLDEKLRKLNLLAGWSAGSVKVTASAYASEWRSTDQVPERAVESGLIPRLGYIDPDLGGSSSRFALTAEGGDAGLRWSAYAIRSSFRLVSNFTYLLDDPVNGHQFIQRDRRWVLGGAIAGGRALSPDVDLRLGGDLRIDLIDRVGLYRAVVAAPIATVREDRVNQWGGAGFAELEARPADGLRLLLGLRADAMGFDVRTDLAANSGRGSAAILSPKASLAWRVAGPVELYLNYGQGFHSNDVRGAAIQVDPATGDPADAVPLFARAQGAEIGARLETKQLTLTAAAFWLRLDSELVFVGDAGTTEPNDASRRLGTELALFWQPAPNLAVDAALALTDARFEGVADNRIPGSVSMVASAGMNWEPRPGLVGTLRLRHFGSAPLIEDGSVESDPTTLVNMGGYWTKGRVRLSAEILNLFDAEAPDISYFYASRLEGEPADGIEDRHIHPAEPRQLRLSMRLTF